jgi:hypothetical protein
VEGDEMSDQDHLSPEEIAERFSATAILNRRQQRQAKYVAEQKIVRRQKIAEAIATPEPLPLLPPHPPMEIDEPKDVADVPASEIVKGLASAREYAFDRPKRIRSALLSAKAAQERKEKERVDETREATRVAQQRAQRELVTNVTSVARSIAASAGAEAGRIAAAEVGAVVGVEVARQVLAQEHEAARAAQERARVAAEAETAARRAKAGAHPANEEIAKAEDIAKNKILEMIRRSPAKKTLLLRQMEDLWVRDCGATTSCIENLTKRALKRAYQYAVAEAGNIISADSSWTKPGPIRK